MNINILQTFIKDCKSNNKEPTWDELRNFRRYKKRAAKAAKLKNSVLLYSETT